MIYLSLGVRWVLGLIFLTAATDKLRHTTDFRRDLGQYPRMRTSLATPLSYTVPMIELVLAASFLTGIYWRIAALVAASLLLVFSVAVTAMMRRGEHQHCGCGGIVPTSTRATGHLVGNGILIMLAITVAMIPESTAGVSLPWHSQWFVTEMQETTAVALVTIALSTSMLLILVGGIRLLDLRQRRIEIDRDVFAIR